MSNFVSMWAGALGFALYFLSVACCLRLWPRKPAHLAVGLAIAVYPVALAVAVLFDNKIFFWSYTAIYGTLTLIFLMAFGAIYKSISFRILLDLSNAPGRSEPYDAVLARLIRSETFSRRVDVMKEGQLVRVESGRLVLEPKGERIAKIVALLQSIFGIERSG